MAATSLWHIKGNLGDLIAYVLHSVKFPPWEGVFRGLPWEWILPPGGRNPMLAIPVDRGTGPKPKQPSEFWELLDALYEIHDKLERLTVYGPEAAEECSRLEKPRGGEIRCSLSLWTGEQRVMVFYLHSRFSSHPIHKPK